MAVIKIDIWKEREKFYTFIDSRRITVWERNGSWQSRGTKATISRFVRYQLYRRVGAVFTRPYCTFDRSMLVKWCYNRSAYWLFWLTRWGRMNYYIDRSMWLTPGPHRHRPRQPHRLQNGCQYCIPYDRTLLKYLIHKMQKIVLVSWSNETWWNFFLHSSSTYRIWNSI